MSITATQVKDLRDRTGAPMMDCKKALTEANGDMEAALDNLRKKGLATAEKRKGRATNEGLIRIHIEPDGKVAGIAEVNCETDFVARNDEFEAYATQLAEHVAKGSHGDLAEVLASTFRDGQTAQETLTTLIGKIGENMLVSRAQRVTLDGPGVIEPYLHAGGRVGVLIALGTLSEDLATKPEFREVAHELALHVAFANPVCLERSGVPTDTIERERRIARERATEQGKPANIVDKIVEGQIGKYYGEVCLLEQPYVKDDKLSVQKWLDEQAKTLGGNAEIKMFVRYGLGEAGGDEKDEGETA